jgi:hypothetical protein
MHWEPKLLRALAEIDEVLKGFDKDHMEYAKKDKLDLTDEFCLLFLEIHLEEMVKARNSLLKVINTGRMKGYFSEREFLTVKEMKQRVKEKMKKYEEQQKAALETNKETKEEPKKKESKKGKDPTRRQCTGDCMTCKGRCAGNAAYDD